MDIKIDNTLNNGIISPVKDEGNIRLPEIIKMAFPMCMLSIIFGITFKIIFFALGI